jgi:glycosyltransferase involved in cell wall biosynthesis
MRSILYINFFRCTYENREAFDLQQRNIILYKKELAKLQDVGYLVNNNLKINDNLENVNLKSFHSNRIVFLIRALFYIKKKKPQHVIIHGLDYFLEAGLIGFIFKMPVVLQHHAEKTYLRKKSILMGITDPYIRAYFFNGKELASPYLEKNIIKNKNKIIEITEATTPFSINEKQTTSTKRIVSIGRLNANKNTITILKAINLLKLSRQDFHLSIFYGTSELELELKTYVETNKLHSFVSFKGSVSQQEVESVLNQSDLFVSASLYEGSGFSLIEAIACGVYPIVSTISAFNYLVSDLPFKQQFEPTNEIELAQKLNAALNTELNTSMRKSIHQYFKKTCSSTAIAEAIHSSLITFK